MGMTPVKTYDPDREIPILVEAGDYIRFVPIDEDEKHQYKAEFISSHITEKLSHGALEVFRLFAGHHTSTSSHRTSSSLFAHASSSSDN